MYNKLIADRIANLKYLYPLKKSNVTIISKTNSFGDVLKFFAQINKDNIIQKISYKASGCSSFVAMCDYFCEIIENKTIDDAIKINNNDLEKLTQLDKSREHVFDIILDTFKLLIKKYKIGIEKNTIVPFENITENNIQEKTEKIAKEKKENLHDGLEDIIQKSPKKKNKKLEIKASEDIKNDNKEVVIENNEIIIDSNDDNVILDREDNLEEIIIDNKENNIIDSNILVVEDDAQESEKIIEVKHEITVVETIKDAESEKTIVEEKKMSHLMALKQKINNKENNEKAHNHANSLSSMLELINKNKENNTTETKKEKKSLFSFFKKK